MARYILTAIFVFLLFWCVVVVAYGLLKFGTVQDVGAAANNMKRLIIFYDPNVEWRLLLIFSVLISLFIAIIQFIINLFR